MEFVQQVQQQQQQQQEQQEQEESQERDDSDESQERDDSDESQEGDDSDESQEREESEESQEEEVEEVEEEEEVHRNRRTKRSRPDDPEQEDRVTKRKRLETYHSTNHEEEDPMSLTLHSGEIMYFKKGEPTNVLLTKSLEPSLLVRKILSVMPPGVVRRLNYLSTFIVPATEKRNSAIVQYYKDLQDKVMSAYMKECKLRFLFKKVINRWRVHKMNRSCEDDVDPITLCPPEKKVVVYDWANKKKFVFEANTLALSIESKLMYYEHGFPTPLYPQNPHNNLEFSYKQMISMYYQLKSHGESMWACTTLRQCNFNKRRWFKFHKSAITLSAIRSSISLLDSRNSVDILSDFLFAKMEELHYPVTRHIVNLYQTAMLKVPNHWYIEKCKYVAMIHFESEHFGENRSRHIHSYCFQLFQKQSLFFKELQSMNIIS